MNMLVSTAIAGTAVPAVAAEPIDPIFAAIEAHKAAAAGAEAVQRQYSDFENELADNERLQRDRRLKDETRRGQEIEAALKQAWHVEQCAAYDLLNVDPTTMAGVVALLAYSEEHDDANCGMGWPDDIHCEELKGNRTWRYFLINNLIEVLPKLCRGWGHRLSTSELLQARRFTLAGRLQNGPS
ncbi:hypothetical protein IVA95_18710 [Bradyrhizobium sp. 157]|uniref:hypothetical protein n=1 Tax=Bradyrhizobium sp. 157 TaxID=2782631 RepID=UPI001FFB6EF6|nr:hypothetical protein [Bradyrhizobium sp. 157]MCK1639591.1 hypothetical protein [Bradyrhizobium sp. 157]